MNNREPQSQFSYIPVEVTTLISAGSIFKSAHNHEQLLVKVHDLHEKSWYIHIWKGQNTSD